MTGSKSKGSGVFSKTPDPFVPLFGQEQRPQVGEREGSNSVTLAIKSKCYRPFWDALMAQILEYATPPQPLSTRKITAALTLILGTAIYAAVCWPAMHRRGYPPMDHFWIGMTYLWVFPIPLFALFFRPGNSPVGR